MGMKYNYELVPTKTHLKKEDVIRSARRIVGNLQDELSSVTKVADKLAKHRWALEKVIDRIDTYSAYNPLSYEDCLQHLTKKEKAKLEFVDWKTYEDK